MGITDKEDMSLPVELEAGEESPFRRRQKAVHVRRNRFSRLRRVLRWGLPGLLVVVLLGYGGYRLAFFMLTSPRFELSSADDIVVTGNRYVSREEILGVFGMPTSGKVRAHVNVVRLSLEEKRKQLETLPWVRSATLTRAFPHRLAVQIEERKPVAFVNVGGRVKLVDGEGVLLERPERADFNFPVVTGLEEAAEPGERRERLALYERFMRELAEGAPRSGWMISEVDLSDPVDLKAILVQERETLQVHFGRDRFGERFHDFLSMLPELRRAGAKIGSVDLRYRNQIVVNPYATATQATDTGTSGSGKE